MRGPFLLEQFKSAALSWVYIEPVPQRTNSHCSKQILSMNHHQERYSITPIPNHPKRILILTLLVNRTTTESCRIDALSNPGTPSDVNQVPA